MTTDILTPNNTKEVETNSNIANEKSTLELNPASEGNSKSKEKPSKVQKPKSKNKGGCRNLFFALKCWGNSTTDEEEGEVRAKEVTTAPIPTDKEIETQPETEPETTTHIPEGIITSVTKDQLPVIIDPEAIDANRASIESRNFLLPPIAKEHAGRKCLVLDLDETLVHSSFKLIEQPDFIVPVEIDNQVHNVYVAKRPGVDDFLFKVGELFEVVVFTASLSKYADPVLDMLDRHKVVYHRLFRESCYNHHGNYVKDLSQLGRDLAHTIIIDNSPTSYIFHPSNAVPITTWFNDKHDTELMDLVPFLADLTTVPDVTAVLDNVNLESA